MEIKPAMKTAFMNSESGDIRIEEISTDICPDPRLRIRQPPNGYRFTMDSVILAQTAAQENGMKILDIGTGCGVIPLIIGHHLPEAQITGIELQKELYDLAVANVAENNMTDRIGILRMDARKITPADTNGRCDMVVSNPPYTARGRGRINPCAQQAIARHEIKLSMQEMIAAASRMLKNGGKFMVVYPQYRLEELVEEMKRAGIKPETIKMVRTKPGQPAKRVLVSAIARTGRDRIDPV